MRRGVLVATAMVLLLGACRADRLRAVEPGPRTASASPVGREPEPVCVIPVGPAPAPPAPCAPPAAAPAPAPCAPRCGPGSAPASVEWDERISPSIDCNPIRTQHTLVV